MSREEELLKSLEILQALGLKNDSITAVKYLPAREARTADYPDDAEPSLVKALKEREEIMSTGIGFGIAIPHAKIGSINEMAFAIGISRPGIDFDSMDGEPVHLVILVAAGEKQHKEYLRLLSNIMAILKKEQVKDTIINSQSNEEVITILKANSL